MLKNKFGRLEMVKRFTFCEQFMSLHFPDAQLGQVGFFFAASEWRNLQFAFRQPLVTKNLQSSHGRSILP